MAKISKYHTPPGGWTFDHGDITLKAESFHALVGRIADYRQGNRLPPGDPEQEIQDQVCLNNSSYCL